jgi:hypothetical protein
MTTTAFESRAQLAYTAYAKAVGFVTKDGKPMPVFDELPVPIRHAWQETARVIWELASTGKATL